jgi:hypothetical protein
LAVSRPSSIGGDWQDVAAVIVAFQAINSVQLEMRLTGASDHGRADILMTLVATELPDGESEAKTLDSVSVRCSAMNRKTLEDALIQALYSLDFKLGSGEFRKILGA